MNAFGGDPIDWLRQGRWGPILLAICVALLLAACGGREVRECPAPGAAGDGVGGEVAVDMPLSRESARARWGAGPHAQTAVGGEPDYDPDCDRCHAPLEAMAIGNTAAETQSPTSQESFSSAVGCPVCHPGGPEEEGGEVGWLPAGGGEGNEPVDEADELCGHCHLADGVDDHLSIVVSGAHAGYDCVDCHEPHSGAASCTDSGCHQPFSMECEPIQSHDRPHLAVSCSGCHAAGEVEIAWDAGREKWHSHRPLEVDGGQVLVPFTAHELSLEVKCERCHTPGDLPWVED
jgi:hypothetical protein